MLALIDMRIDSGAVAALMDSEMRQFRPHFSGFALLYKAQSESIAMMREALYDTLND